MCHEQCSHKDDGIRRTARNSFPKKRRTATRQRQPKGKIILKKKQSKSNSTSVLHQYSNFLNPCISSEIECSGSIKKEMLVEDDDDDMVSKAVAVVLFLWLLFVNGGG